MLNVAQMSYVIKQSCSGGGLREHVAGESDNEDPGKPEEVIRLIRGLAGQGAYVVFFFNSHTQVAL